MTAAPTEPAGPSESFVEPIAIVGMAVKVPGADSVEQFWRNLIGGVESVRFFTREEQAALGVPADRLDDPAFVRAAAMLDDVEYFDAAFFGMTPREAEIRDPQQRLFLELAHTALEDSGYDPERYDGEIGVYGGIGPDQYQWKNVRRNPAVLASTGIFAMVTANHSSYLSTLTSYKLNLRGPSLTVQTACSTSLVALHLACEALRNRECEMALAGATAIDVPHGWGYGYAEGGIMSPDGHCRAFDADSAGTLWGSGGGVVVLKRLADAVAEGDTIRAVVLGNAINNDGAAKVGFSAPSVAGQTAVIAQALGVGGVDPRTVTYVEAHGTGTALGDPIEVAALSAAFGAASGDTQWCALGSVKTNIGHLGAASGIAGLVKAVLALQHGMIPPSLHFETPHPKIDFESSPFYVNATPSAWSAQDGPRRAGVSSFGVGGTNAHIVLEEAPPAAPRPDRPAVPALVRVSARTPEALTTLTERLAGHLAARPDADLADVAATLGHGRQARRHRACTVVDGTAEAAAALIDPARLRSGQAAARPPRVALLFSGQGAQYAGMGAQLYRTEPVFRDAVDECAGLLRDHLELDVREMFLAGGEERLTQTAFAQPALFTVEYALARVWAAWGVESAALLGHSIGEYVAATLAGVFSLPDALRLVARRGALMQAQPAGAMLAVRLDEADLRGTLPDGLSVAVVNGPGACVVAGPVEAVDGYEAGLRERSVGCARLRTSHAFHSAMMEPILEAFRDEVAAVERREPTRALLSNLTGGWATTVQLTDPAYWARHLRETVRFGDNLTALLADGDWIVLEVGPGGQLAGLARQHPAKIRRQPLTSLPGPDGPAGDLHAMLEAAGRLWVSGVDVDPAGPPARRVRLPTYPYERKYFWVRPTEPDEQPAPAPHGGPLPIEDWFAVPAWRQITAPPTGDRRPGTLSGDVVVIGDGSWAAELAERLRATGAGVRLAGLDDVESLAAGDPLPARIVHTGAWQAAAAGTDPAAAWAAQDAGFFSVLALCQALAAARPETPVHLDIITAGTQAVVGGDLVSPEHATVAGPALVLPLELPWLTVRHVDAPAGPGTAAAVAAELLRPPPDGATTVALRGGRRWIRDWEAVPVRGDGGAGVLRQGAVCLVTGGLGGLGITAAEDLATRVGARLVLLSRTRLPERSAWDEHLAVHGGAGRVGRAIGAIRRIERSGAEVLVLDGDVTDVVDLRRVRDRILRRFGRLDAIVHSAGVAGGGMAEVKQRAQAEAVLAPKILGTLALARVFGDLPLDAVVLFGSITGVAGGFGQVDYCGANAFLDAVAQAGTAFTGRTVSIDWGNWLEVGMAAEVAAPSAFRVLQRGLVSTPMAHPVLTTAHRDPATGTAWCTGTVGPATHWVLDEHRLAGHAVMPGTGHLASVVAAGHAVLDGGGRLVELRDVALVEPLVVSDDGQAEIRVAFAEGADDADFQVTSRSAGQERTHVRGTLAWVAGDPAPVHDLAAIRARCRSGADQESRTSQSGLFTFGPRWSSLRDVDAGPVEAIALIEAAGPVAAELDQWHPHPALLDEAVSFAATRLTGRCMPLGYGRLLLRSPLPARFWSHLRYRDAGTSEVIVADFTLLADDGTEIASISDFVLRRIDPDALGAELSGSAASAARVPAVTTTDATGIAPADGADALRRVLAHDLGPQVSVTAAGIHASIAGARALTQQTVEENLAGAVSSRPERTLDDGGYVAPTTDLQRVLCHLWQDMLGLDRIGVDDDFFAAGGNSLVAVQLIAGIRAETGVRIPMRLLFEASTVAGMAAEIEQLRAGAAAAGDGEPGEPEITALPRPGR